MVTLGTPAGLIVSVVGLFTDAYKGRALAGTIIAAAAALFFFVR